MLRTRIYTAVVLVLLIAAVLFSLPPRVGIGVLAFVLAAGAWEWAAFAGCTALGVRIGYVVATLLIGLATAQGLGAANAYQLMWVAAAWWIVAGIRLSFFAHERVSVAMTLVAGWLTLLPAVTAVALLFAGPFRVDGNLFFILLLALVAAADIGAYFAGRRFGRLKLAPQVSPGKTWEGVIGGALLVGLVAIGFATAFGWSRPGFIGVASLVFVASIVGDLSESLFKRGAGLKDSGTILPGHGGILDRIDSLTAAAPFYVLGLRWMGLLQ
ncbi:MAG: phosphatidate cytidylyltransferase [Pseudomonadota bacterium]|jgi:phosphatidate cytidylyltransferase